MTGDPNAEDAEDAEDSLADLAGDPNAEGSSARKRSAHSPPSDGCIKRAGCAE